MHQCQLLLKFASLRLVHGNGNHQKPLNVKIQLFDEVKFTLHPQSSSSNSSLRDSCQQVGFRRALKLAMFELCVAQLGCGAINCVRCIGDLRVLGVLGGALAGFTDT